MKKTILVIVGLIMSFLANAQDMILLRNGDEIQCKVDMISNGIVSYQENGTRSQMPTTQLYMIKYEKRGKAFFNSEGESNYNSESTSAKLSKKDIAIYLCDGGEIIASEVKFLDDNIDYKASNKKKWNAIIPIKKSGEWNSLAKEKVFLIRYFDGSREVINDLQKIEEQARMNALPKVKHPFVPINKDENYPCPAEIKLNDGNSISVIIYDMEREYVHYRKKEWQDGPIFRMQRMKIKDIIIK
jgi:hypothetical protein